MVAKKTSTKKEERQDKINHAYRGEEVTPLAPDQIADVQKMAQRIGSQKTRGFILVVEVKKGLTKSTATGTAFIHQVSPQNVLKIIMDGFDFSVADIAGMYVEKRMSSE